MNATIIICTSENFHPYECRDERNPAAVCRHCMGIKDATHDPERCALCHWDDEGFGDPGDEGDDPSSGGCPGCGGSCQVACR